MQVNLNTDNHVQGNEALAAPVEGVVESVLGRFRKQITRIEVHSSDVNGAKSGSGDKRCVMEARLQGRPPAAASNDGDTMRVAISGAAHKLQRLLDSSLGKLAG